MNYYWIQAMLLVMRTRVHFLPISNFHSAELLASFVDHLSIVNTLLLQCHTGLHLKVAFCCDSHLGSEVSLEIYRQEATNLG